MVAVPPPPGSTGPSLRSVLEGLRYVRGQPILLGMFLTDLVGTFFGWPTAAFPALAVLYTRSPGALPAATALGFLYAAPALGALLASLTSGWTRRVHHHGRGVILAVVVWGTAVACLGLSPTLWLAILSLMLVGGANLISGIFRGALANETIPDTLRGRLAGIELISYSSGPVLGDVETGAVATVFTPGIAVFSGGLLCILGVGLVALAVPSLRRYDNRDKPA
jgi:MFS family permease